VIFPFDELSFLHGVELSPDFPPIDPKTSFSNSDSAPSSSQESLFSSSNPTISPFPQAPPPPTNSPDRPFCYLRSKSFKRTGNLKRHEGVHLPEQWKCYCKQPDCVRKGRKGFYGRNKLRTHGRQVQGLDFWLEVEVTKRSSLLGIFGISAVERVKREFRGNFDLVRIRVKSLKRVIGDEEH
jgi:hypothetical protein